jgi:adenylylsulfate kinase-like enzyme
LCNRSSGEQQFEKLKKYKNITIDGCIRKYYCKLLIMVIWIIGMSGSGKTFTANYLKKKIQSKYQKKNNSN